MTDDELSTMRDIQRRIAMWQAAQFPDATLRGATVHLHREIEEACEELADVFFLASQCERLMGMPVCMPEIAWQAIASLGRNPSSVILAKLAKNLARKWPEKPDASGVYEADDAQQTKAQNQG
jgi:hypothetical protein